MILLLRESGNRVNYDGEQPCTFARHSDPLDPDSIVKMVIRHSN